MSFLIGLLTVVLVLNCLLLILLVLIQLPKKEAGAGIAFGGSAADALFGAGSGNVLTKTTKYATISFFVLLILLGSMQSSVYHKSTAEFQRRLEQQSQSGGLPVPPMEPAAKPSASPGATNLLTLPPSTAPIPTDAPAAPAPQK